MLTRTRHMQMFQQNYFFSHIITVAECCVGTLPSCKIYLLNDRHGLSLYGGFKT